MEHSIALSLADPLPKSIVKSLQKVSWTFLEAPLIAQCRTSLDVLRFHLDCLDTFVAWHCQRIFPSASIFLVRTIVQPCRSGCLRQWYDSVDNWKSMAFVNGRLRDPNELNYQLTGNSSPDNAAWSTPTVDIPFLLSSSSKPKHHRRARFLLDMSMKKNIWLIDAMRRLTRRQHTHHRFYSWMLFDGSQTICRALTSHSGQSSDHAPIRSTAYP